MKFILLIPSFSKRKGRRYAEDFMAENVLLVPVADDLSSGLATILSFLEKWRGVPGRVCL